MTYRERILEKIQEARSSIQKVKKYLPESMDEFQKMDIQKDGIYKNIEFSIQAILDICFMLVKEFDLGIPDEETGAFELLERKKILSRKTVEKIADMRGFRNFLVHRYGNIDDETAFNNIKNGLGDFEEIFREMEKATEK